MRKGPFGIAGPGIRLDEQKERPFGNQPGGSGMKQKTLRTVAWSWNLRNEKRCLMRFSKSIIIQILRNSQNYATV